MSPHEPMIGGMPKRLPTIDEVKAALARQTATGQQAAEQAAAALGIDLITLSEYLAVDPAVYGQYASALTVGWNRDVAAAPRGEDVLIAVRTSDPDGRFLTQIGMLIWEPSYKEPGETDDDIDGYFGEVDGKMGVWFWHANDDGYTKKKEIAAWRPMPPQFVLEPLSKEGAA